MNRKERRAAQKGKPGSPPRAGPPAGGPAGFGNTLFAGAVSKFQAGDTGEAERLCRDLLGVEPNHADALHLLGMIAARTGRHDAARDLIGHSLSLNPRNADAAFNLAQVDLALGRIDEAARGLLQTIALRGDHAIARRQLADICLRQGQMEQAALYYRDALKLRGDDAEACCNLGVALAALGRWNEAVETYRRALALNPALVDVYRNLGRLVLAQGDTREALALARRGLAVHETEEMRMFFVQCARVTPAADADDGLRDLVARALNEGWSRPSELAELAADLFKRSDDGGPSALEDNIVLRALLNTSPVCDIALERRLTDARTVLLGQALRDEAIPLSAFACALARQCFINEYVFAVGGDEERDVARLRDDIDAALASGEKIAPLRLVALACYIPLHTLGNAEVSLNRPWPDGVSRLLELQVREPLIERDLRANISALTAIDDAVSLKVQAQYEDMPYPRWITAAPVGRPVAVERYLRNQFPRAPIRQQLSASCDVLIAGCGTGQQAIEAARRYAGAQVLAVDLSRTSLGYAMRKARALSLGNLAFAHADILKLGSLGRTFDVIESSGVLHHLGDPAEGWRVLLSLLRSGGFMNIGLYSALARADIRAARAFIAQRGHGDTANDIRRARQDILALADDTPLKRVTRYPDFFGTSECRDLLFHVQEHQLTIPAIKAFIAAHGLTFLGFSGLPLGGYHRRFPNDPAACDLDQWHAFETENPETFTGMYQFWLQKP